MKGEILIVAVLCSLPGCASIEDKDWKPQVRNDDDFVTGSHLPRRKADAPREVTIMSKEQLEDLQRPRPGPIPTGSGR
jgi:hypothetical protein